MRIVTNNQPRAVIDARELTSKERADFDYLDWHAIDANDDSASFFRYKRQLYDLGEFSSDYGITQDVGLPVYLSKWDGYMSVHAFMAIVVRYSDTFDSVVVGTVYS
jgi:hypothetical protein